jgi:hypothetical protein
MHQFVCHYCSKLSLRETIEDFDAEITHDQRIEKAGWLLAPSKAPPNVCVSLGDTHYILTYQSQINLPLNTDSFGLKLLSYFIQNYLGVFDIHDGQLTTYIAGQSAVRVAAVGGGRFQDESPATVAVQLLILMFNADRVAEIVIAVLPPDCPPADDTPFGDKLVIAGQMISGRIMVDPFGHYRFVAVSASRGDFSSVACAVIVLAIMLEVDSGRYRLIALGAQKVAQMVTVTFHLPPAGITDRFLTGSANAIFSFA